MKTKQIEVSPVVMIRFSDYSEKPVTAKMDVLGNESGALPLGSKSHIELYVKLSAFFYLLAQEETEFDDMAASGEHIR